MEGELRSLQVVENYKIETNLHRQEFEELGKREIEVHTKSMIATTTTTMQHFPSEWSMGTFTP